MSSSPAPARPLPGFVHRLLRIAHTGVPLLLPPLLLALFTHQPRLLVAGTAAGLATLSLTAGGASCLLQGRRRMATLLTLSGTACGILSLWIVSLILETL